MTSSDEQALALAGLFQAVALVRAVAREGQADAAAVEAALASTLRIDAGSVVEVYGGAARLTLGLEVLQRQLGTTSRARDPELTRYAAGVLHLERRLARRDDLLATLRTGIEHAGGLAEAHGPASSGVIEALAAVYVDTIARLGPRIMVGGEPHILRDPRNAGRIRALLLTGIRSAVLWRQLGGSRLRLFLERRRYAEAARTLAGDCPA